MAYKYCNVGVFRTDDGAFIPTLADAKDALKTLAIAASILARRI